MNELHYRDHKWFEKHDWMRVKFSEVPINDEHGARINTRFVHILMCDICGRLKTFRTQISD